MKPGPRTAGPASTGKPESTLRGWAWSMTTCGLTASIPFGALTHTITGRFAPQNRSPEVCLNKKCLHFLQNTNALIGFRGSYAPTWSEKHDSFFMLLKNKGFKEEKMTQVRLYAIGTSTTLESNKSLRGNVAFSTATSLRLATTARRGRLYRGMTRVGRQARSTASTDSRPGRAATTRTMATSSPSARRRKAVAAPSGGP
jgi:hypothetical protein